MARNGGGGRAAATAALLGLLGLSGSLPAAGQPVPVVPAAASNRDVYLHHVQDEMSVWRMKMGGMKDKAEATGQATATNAETDLRSAWHRTEAGASNLQAASSAGWADAKSAYEQASQDLSRAWDKTRL